ncbi:MAG: FlgD immunoglobulin-like domain containing protein [Candidatus Latescibacterota bacterium]
MRQPHPHGQGHRKGLGHRSAVPLLRGLALAGLLRFWVCGTPAAEELVLGGAERPWETYGAAAGGVIGFVDRLDSLRAPDGAPLFAETASSPGWIMPLRLRPDFNISLGVLQRGGAIDTNLPSDQVPAEQLTGVLDQDHTIAFDRKLVVGRVVQNNGVALEIDLGARFGVDRIVFYPRMTDQFPFGTHYLRAFELFVNDGLPQNLYASGRPIYTSPVVRQPDNGQARVEAVLQAQFVRFVRLKSFTTVGFEIDEIEVYGAGFVPEARYESRVLDLGEPRVWGDVGWATARAGGEAESEVAVRARSGGDPTPDVYLRTLTVGTRVVGRTPLDENGDTLTQQTYQAMLRQGKRGAVEPDAANWSQWQVLTQGGPLDLPAPRRYLQFRVDFASRGLDAARALGQIVVEHTGPVADEIVAEIAPASTVAGQRTTFTFVARMVNPSGLAGFDRFAIETPARVAAVRSVAVWDAAGVLFAEARFADLAEAALPLQVGSFAVEEVADDHFTLRTPRLAAHGTRLQVVFDAAAFRYGTRFLGRAYAGESGLPQLTAPGDASPELETDGLQVRVTVGSGVLSALEVSPAVLTPNGDGVNDRAAITCTVLHLLEPSPMQVGVFDLSGRRMRRLDVGPVRNGRTRTQWDGRDEDGVLAMPGIYLVAVEVDADRRTEARVAQLAVAY